MLEKWVATVKTLAKVATRYPQSAYAGFTQSLQSEWQYLWCCIPGVEDFLGPVEDAIHEFFLPAIPQEKAEEMTDDFHQLLSHGVKQGGLIF